ncbi:hypothetical protein D6833_13430 [Candidatus Parcubacteria bacterium]|nr:MAG: hypothetical protein D6833_13430 [Candidatus Parcubacteria bacterium]
MFYDTELGRRCFRAICEDLYAREKSQADKPPVRISIAFLDWKHRHKETGYVFERRSLDDICPECIKGILAGEVDGKEFLRGQLVQLALTRVPVNERTLMEVDRSMAEEITTKLEDAASIIGEDLAKEIEKKTESMVGKSQALVVKSEEGAEDEPQQPDVLQQVLERLAAIEKSLAEKPRVTHPLDEALDKLRTVYDTVAKSDMAAEEKLRLLQTPYEELGKLIADSVGAKEERSEVGSDDGAIVEAFAKALEPLAQKLDLLVQQSQSSAQPAPQVPPRRSIQPDAVVTARSQPDGGGKLSLRDIVRRQYGLPS